ncbi:hypothetical protein [Herbidospora galbida]|uniref:hypothetical protein n=1 Tax=Herbidospora galbida TaxID=2575442 RepID=UPI001FEB5E36|nr:hypothetical protein [Herbidospora galbida]
MSLSPLLLDTLQVSVRPNGETWIRDPRTTPMWHNLSTLLGYPADVQSVSSEIIIDLAGVPSLHVSVQTTSGGIHRTVCQVGVPIPGGFLAPGQLLGPAAYPNNCTDWVNQTPPFRVAT